jgi:hypothetical protein
MTSNGLPVHDDDLFCPNAGYALDRRSRLYRDGRLPNFCLLGVKFVMRERENG